MPKENRSPQVTFHPGLAKTASTWLQHRFFPRLTGVHNIPRRHYRRYPELINRGDHQNYIVSREFDHQFQQEVTRFASHFPHAGTILMLRRHDGYIASQYRRYLKNARYAEFTDFLDLDNDRGIWKRDELLFMPMLELLQSRFRRPPLVLFHRDLLEQPHRVLGNMADYIGATYDRTRVDLGRVHASYGEKQLKVMRAITRRLPWRPRPQVDNRLLHWMQVRTRLLACHTVLATTHLIPSFVVGRTPLIPPEELRRVSEHYAGDWDACETFAAVSNHRALGGD